MKVTAGVIVMLLAIVVTFNLFLGGNSEPVAAPTLPTQPVPIESTATPAPTPTAQSISSYPVRVQFDLGSYGETITATVSTAYLLWARAGQAFTTTLASNSTATASLYAPDGVALYQGLAAGYTAKATLPTNGNRQVVITSNAQAVQAVQALGPMPTMAPVVAVVPTATPRSAYVLNEVLAKPVPGGGQAYIDQFLKTQTDTTVASAGQ